MPDGMILTGAHVVAYINGKPYGRVAGINVQSLTPSEEIRGLDSPLAIELADTIVSCQGSITVFRTLADGGAEGGGLSAPVTLLSREKYFTITLVDRVTDTVVFEARQARVQAQGWPIQTRALVAGTIQFRAISWENEVRPSRR
jgi:hypothetical protein